MLALRLNIDKLKKLVPFLANFKGTLNLIRFTSLWVNQVLFELGLFSLLSIVDLILNCFLLAEIVLLLFLLVPALLDLQFTTNLGLMLRRSLIFLSLFPLLSFTKCVFF